MTEQERIRKTIRDLLNLSENDAAFEQEAENALRFARKLMMRHHIDQSDLEAERTQDEVDAAADVEYGSKHCYSETSGIAEWERFLNRCISRLIGTVNWYYSTGHWKQTRHGAHIYLDNGKRKRAAKITFYGPTSDVIDALELVDEWRQIIIAMARLKFGTVFRGTGRSYCEGFVYGLEKKLDNINQEEKREAKLSAPDQSNALMIRNSSAIMQAKKEKGKDWLKNVARIELKKRSSFSTARHDLDAYQRGKTDGSKATISRSNTKRLES
jgi:hypothetical protein